MNTSGDDVTSCEGVDSEAPALDNGGGNGELFDKLNTCSRGSEARNTGYFSSASPLTGIVGLVSYLYCLQIFARSKSPRLTISYP